MFKALISRREKTKLLYQAFKETEKMLQREVKMFSAAVDSLMLDKPADIDIPRYDKDINLGERMVRRMIVEHLTFNPKQDLPASLVLISIVIDIERIGDYTKSILEIAELYKGKLLSGKYAEQYALMKTEILKMFDLTIDAFIKSDMKKAQKVMDKHQNIKATCDSILSDLFKEKKMQRDRIITITLASRYYRRVSAHLSNIVSSVIQPFDKIGFEVDEE
jgi:phosphate transport system protein